jgi:hypothetical protein
MYQYQIAADVGREIVLMESAKNNTINTTTLVGRLELHCPNKTMPHEKFKQTRGIEVSSGIDHYCKTICEGVSKPKGSANTYHTIIIAI